MLETDRIFPQLLPDLEKADQNRQSRLQKTVPFKRFFIICTILSVGFTVYIIADPGMPSDLWGISLFLFFFGIIIFTIKYAYESQKFKRYFQKEIAPRLIENFGPDFTYDAGGKIAEKYLEKANFFRYYNRYKCEDLITGKIGEKPVVFGEIHLEKESGSGSKSKKTTIFRGIFITIQLGIDFPAPFWILPTKRKPVLEYPGLKKVNGEVIRIEHGEFSKTYSVFGENPAFTLKLLQKPILDSMVSLNNNLQSQKVIYGSLVFAFIDNMIFVAMTLKQRLLEAGSLSEPVNTKTFIEKQLLVLNGIYKVARIVG